MKTLIFIHVFYMLIFFCSVIHGMDELLIGNQTSRHRRRRSSANETANQASSSSNVASISGIQHGVDELLNEDLNRRHQRRRASTNEISNQAPSSGNAASSSRIQHVHTLPPGFRIEHRGYYHAGPDNIHLVHFGPASGAYAVTNRPGLRAEPADINNSVEIYNRNRYHLGQIVMFRDRLSMIYASTPDGRQRNIRLLNDDEEELYDRMRERNPIRPNKYRIPPVSEPGDQILRVDRHGDGRLKRVGIINKFGLMEPTQSRLMILRDNDVLVRPMGRDNGTGKPVFKSIALGWRGIWIAEELLPLIQGEP